MPLKLSELESDVSLITGGSRVMTSQADENGNISAKNNSALTSRDDGLSVIHYAAAGLRFNFYTYSQIFETKSTRKEKP